MKRAVMSSVLLGLSMLVAAGAATLLTPTRLLADSRPALTLATLVPQRFGDWRDEPAAVAAVVDPGVAAALRQIYTQTLTRTYVNGAGYRIMLSLAYGANQSDALQWHYPETCYPAQGFELRASRPDLLRTAYGSIAVRRLETQLAGRRFEPVTYWSTVGDVVVAGGIDKKLAEMRYRLGGQIPDGLLFRVSAIDADPARAFARQDDFVNDLAHALAPAGQRRLMGLGSGPRPAAQAR